MIVVVIMGILATIAVYGVRKYILAAKTAEPIQVIGAIKTAQEAYYDEAFTYLDVTGSLNTYYPADPGVVPFGNVIQWGGDVGLIDDNFKRLGVNVPQAVLYRYAVAAGAANEAVVGLGTANYNEPNPPTGPWYVVKAIGDLDVDGNTSLYIGSSFTNLIYQQDGKE